MTPYNATPEELPSDSQALRKLKEERAADAEKIRQDFIKSKRLNPARAAVQKPLPEPNQDER